MATKKKVFLYTDGACSGNPGPGGWAALLKYRNSRLGRALRQAVGAVSGRSFRASPCTNSRVHLRGSDAEPATAAIIVECLATYLYSRCTNQCSEPAGDAFA